ncbi:MAG: STAS domain-containing protein, partial [Gemmatimonadetes bacterium]|nr:STAS domain-containing protein [Gemmatimonadota bacterium]
MRLKNRTVDDVVIVEVHGDLRGGPDSDTFRELFKDLLEQGHRKFLLNFKGCKWISSPGVGMIVGVFTSIRNRDGQLKIGDYGERIHNLFTTIYLWKVIELYT